MAGTSLPVVILLCLCSLSKSEQTLQDKIRHALARSERAVLTCQDSSQCDQIDDICVVGDSDIVDSLCPAKCGGCQPLVCEDNPLLGTSCADSVPGICSDDLGYTLCAKSCNLCATPAPTVCKDYIQGGLTCADLPDPCSQSVGQLACPQYCGLCPGSQTTTQSPSVGGTGQPCDNAPCLNGGTCVDNGSTFTCQCPSSHNGAICHIATTTAPPATAAAPTAAPNRCNTNTTKYNVGCNPAEIVFLIEYAYSDRYNNAVDHEGDFIKELIDEWQIDDQHIRIGIVVYHDTVTESIHIGDYSGDKRGLNNRISQITRNLRPSGSADLAKALDFARENSFTGSRPFAERIVAPIIHQMSDGLNAGIPAAAQKLKDSCISVIASTVYSGNINYDVIKASVTQPPESFWTNYNNFDDLENAAKFYYKLNCPNNTG